MVMGDRLMEVVNRLDLDKHRELILAAINALGKFKACPHYPKVYALFASPTIRHFITFHWGYVSSQLHHLAQITLLKSC